MDGPMQTWVSSTQNTCCILIRLLAHISKAHHFDTIVSASCCWGSIPHAHTHLHVHTQNVKQGKHICVVDQYVTDPIHTAPVRHINKHHYGLHYVPSSLYHWTGCNTLTGTKWTWLCQFLTGLCVLKHKLTQWQSTVCLLVHIWEKRGAEVQTRKKTIRKRRKINKGVVYWEKPHYKEQVSNCTNDI